MNKNTIFIVVIVVILAAVGYILYYSLFAGKSTNTSLQNGQSNSITSPYGPILPYGNHLDFAAVQKYNTSGHSFDYPAVNPSDVGTSLNTIIKSP